MEIVSKMPRSPQIFNAVQLLYFMNAMKGAEEKRNDGNESGRKKSH